MLGRRGRCGRASRRRGCRRRPCCPPRSGRPGPRRSGSCGCGRGAVLGAVEPLRCAVGGEQRDAGARGGDPCARPVGDGRDITQRHILAGQLARVRFGVLAQFEESGDGERRGGDGPVQTRGDVRSVEETGEVSGHEGVAGADQVDRVARRAGQSVAPSVVKAVAPRAPRLTTTSASDSCAPGRSSTSGSLSSEAMSRSVRTSSGRTAWPMSTPSARSVRRTSAPSSSAPPGPAQRTRCPRRARPMATLDSAPATDRQAESAAEAQRAVRGRNRLNGSSQRRGSLPPQEPSVPAPVLSPWMTRRRATPPRRLTDDPRNPSSRRFSRSSHGRATGNPSPPAAPLPVDPQPRGGLRVSREVRRPQPRPARHLGTHPRQPRMGRRPRPDLRLAGNRILPARLRDRRTVGPPAAEQVNEHM